MGYKEDALEFLGITQWHKAGYTGKGTIIVSDEKVCEKTHPDVISPKGFNSKRGHGDDVMSHIKLIAPDASLVAFPFSGTFGSTEYKCDSAEYIKENKAHIFTTSNLGAYPNTGHQKAIQDCISAGCLFFAAAGNDGDRGLKGESKYEGYWAIGGIRPRFTGNYDKEDEPLYDWTDMYKVSYSAEGEELDYVTIAEILGVSGTSFCAPIKAAMIDLVQQFFIEKIGRRLTRAEMECFINDNLLDVEKNGFDIYTGHGIFKLPNPETIKISDYVSEIGEGIDYGGFPEVRSDVAMRGIDKLHPELQVCVNKFLNACKSADLDVCITETLRTQAEQEALYAKGRTAPGKIVTNCKGFQSPHCWGVAFDFCRNKKGWEYDNTDGFFDKVGRIAETMFNNTDYDLFWGGDFRTFVDKPHVEMKKYLPNNSTNWLIDNYGTPEEFMSTWYDMKGEGEEYMHRYKTVEEMPEYAQEPIQELIDKGILAGKGGELGLDLTEDMIRMLIISKKIFETGEK